jgi:predicted 2-oxoglutarate/Fe(II)-dependent dioxygenase YbiX
MNIFDLILVIKNHLNDEECQLLINEYERKKITSGKEDSYNTTEKKIMQTSYKRVEVTDTSANYNLVRYKTEQALSQWLEYLDQKKSFNVAIYRDILRYTYHNFRILKYDTGSRLHPHTDWEFFNYASVTLNLNDNYAGGEFSFMNGKHVISLEKGDALVFPTDNFWVHEVYPITNGIRYSVNSFISALPMTDKDKIFKDIHDSMKKHNPIFKL